MKQPHHKNGEKRSLWLWLAALGLLSVGMVLGGCARCSEAQEPPDPSFLVPLYSLPPTRIDLISFAFGAF